MRFAVTIREIKVLGQCDTRIWVLSPIEVDRRVPEVRADEAEGR